MSVKLTNNATSLLAGSLTTTATTVSLTAGEGSKFPSLSAGDWFPITIVAADGSYEIMKVTARAIDALTVVRGQEGTTAKLFDPGARVDLRITAAVLSAILRPGDGTAAAPAFTFDSDDDTGLYREAANTLGIAAGGTKVATVAASGLTVFSAGTAALAVGRLGATNPALQVDASATTAATGLLVTAAAAGGGVGLAAISSGDNESLKLDAKGSGSITLGGTSTGAISLARATTVQDSLSVTLAASGQLVPIEVTRAGSLRAAVVLEADESLSIKTYNDDGSARKTVLAIGRDGGLTTDGATVWTSGNLDSTDLARLTGGNSFSGLQTIMQASQGAIAQTTQSLGAIMIQGADSDSAAAFMCFHRPNRHAEYFGLDTDNKWKVGGFSAGAVAYEVWHEGTFTPSSKLDVAGGSVTGNLGIGGNGTVAGTLGVTGTLTASGALNVGGNLTGSGSISAAAASGFYLGSAKIAYVSGNYTVVADPSAGAAMYLGGSGSPANYWYNTTHYFGSRDTNTVFMTLNASGASILGNTAWHAGNFTPSAKANLSGAAFTGAVSASVNSYAISGYTTNVSAGGVIGYAQNTSIYGILGHANAYALYGVGALYVSGSMNCGGTLSQNGVQVATVTGVVSSMRRVDAGAQTVSTNSGSYAWASAPSGAFVSGVRVNDNAQTLEVNSHYAQYYINGTWYTFSG
jgi:hypothetical protein